MTCPLNISISVFRKAKIKEGVWVQIIILIFINILSNTTTCTEGEIKMKHKFSGEVVNGLNVTIKKKVYATGSNKNLERQSELTQIEKWQPVVNFLYLPSILIAPSIKEIECHELQFIQLHWWPFYINQALLL